jgi:hypothetical protein
MDWKPPSCHRHDPFVITAATWNIHSFLYQIPVASEVQFLHSFGVCRCGQKGLQDFFGGESLFDFFNGLLQCTAPNTF